MFDQIASGEIFGSIAHGGVDPSQPTQDWAAVTVTFTDDPEPYNSHRTVERVARAIKDAARFEQELANSGRSIARSKDFVTKVSFSRWRGGRVGRAAADG